MVNGYDIVWAIEFACGRSMRLVKIGQRFHKHIRYNDPCTYCTRRSQTTDHVTPKSKGGKKDNNLVGCCRRCNEDKGSDGPLEFLIKRRSCTKQS